MVALLGSGDELLRVVETGFDADVHVRGNEITITGPTLEVERLERLFHELVTLVGRGHQLDRSVIDQTIRMVQADTSERPSQVLTETFLTHRGKSIRPKTLGQKHYLDAIRKNVVTFSIGPAGTGKTYLAMAAAVQALRAKQVTRLILTRPAVEAGERLGFLPGTLHEKIDPYLKPLWDALHDMMGADELVGHVDRGTIEVAPLAYMRGRAQPVSTPVATPDGFRPIGELRPGDTVIGANGHPTAVVGVFPQGVKPIFEVVTQDGASTRCCAEHLWAVWTRSDRRYGREPRVIETAAMIGRLRTAHYRQFELPLTQPVEFTPRDPPMDPPMDPYALGLSLTDEERGGSAGAALDPRPAGGALLVAERTVSAPVRTASLPREYLLNDVTTRVALLQGLLDSSPGSIVRTRDGVAVRYVVTDEGLRDDVVFLVRSLGGVASTLACDAHVLEIRLPPVIVPFRSRRKLETYQRIEGGRPMRFIDSIEPVGDEETVCIRVAADDQLYVTEDFLVTHNTLNDAFIVLDEAQNTTPEQMKMFLTRIGFGSQAVVTGDVSQIDLPRGNRSGLKVVTEILDEIDGVDFAYLGSGDVVRHHIVQRIVEAYDRYEALRQGVEGSDL
ncbi:MAG: PhoH family protein [Actinobacteria bacterium]|nr:PhoH family protein [Actinomycetota bacterium]